MSYEPKKNDHNRKPPQEDPDGKRTKSIITMIVVALVFTVIINMVYTAITNASLKPITLSEYETWLENGKIKEYKIEVLLTDSTVAQVECQINGVHLTAAAATDGKSTITAPAEWFNDGMDMIHVRAMDADGGYLHVSEEPEAATIGNYFLYE